MTVINLRFLFALLAIVFFWNCNNDDSVSIEDQNAFDDAAIEDFLQDFYMDNERGRVTAFDPDDDFDDNFPSLLSLATQDPSGFWYAKNPNIDPQGPRITSNLNDSLLISYDLRYFRATNDTDNPYGTIFGYRNTINGTGFPQWDPNFYFSGISQDEETARNRPEFFEIEGIIEGFMKFNTTNSNPLDVFNFQGVIVVPSRLAFARDINLQTIPLNATFIINFELHRITNRID